MNFRLFAVKHILSFSMRFVELYYYLAPFSSSPKSMNMEVYRRLDKLFVK